MVVSSTYRMNIIVKSYFFSNNEEKNNEGVIQEKNSEISGANAKCDEKHVKNSSST